MFIISGYAGVLGREITKILPANQVIPISFRKQSVNEIGFKFEQNKDSCIYLHLAWPVQAASYKNSKDNIRMLDNSKTVFRLAAKYKIPIVAAGTILEAGDSGMVGDFIVPDPQSLYAETKYQLSKFLFDNVDTRSVWLRIAYQISQNDPSHKLIPTIMKNPEKELKLDRPHDSLDFIHAQDVATAFVHVLERLETLNYKTEMVVGVGRGLSVESLVDAFGKQAKTKQIDTKVHITNPQLIKEIGWSPQAVSPSSIYELCNPIWS